MCFLWGKSIERQLKGICIYIFQVESKRRTRTVISLCNSLNHKITPTHATHKSHFRFDSSPWFPYFWPLGSHKFMFSARGGVKWLVQGGQKYLK